MSPVERAEHQKQVKAWFSYPTKFRREIDEASKTFPFHCLSHLSSSHKFEACGVLKAGDKSANSSKHTHPLTNHGQLNHTTEDSVDDKVNNSMADLPDYDVLVEDTDNEDALPYFARMTNHFLRLVKTSPDSLVSRHSMQFPIIANSGANFHMFWDIER